MPPFALTIYWHWSLKGRTNHGYKSTRPESCRDFHKPGPDGLAPIGTWCPEISSHIISMSLKSDLFYQSNKSTHAYLGTDRYILPFDIIFYP